jgi:hypothetical protein
MLLMADSDEYLALMNRTSGNLADLVATGCLEGVTQAIFHVQDVGYEHCGEADEMACFGTGAHACNC